MNILVLCDSFSNAPIGRLHSLEELSVTLATNSEADVVSVLRSAGHNVHILSLYDDLKPLLEELATSKPDLVFNMVESFGSNRAFEPYIPAVLDLMGISYTGSPCEVLYLCKNKALPRALLKGDGVRMPNYLVSLRHNSKRRLRGLSYPVIVKPLSEEASDGINLRSYAGTERDVLKAISRLHRHHQCDAIVEEYIVGRELYLGVVGADDPIVFSPMELFFSKMPAHRIKFATSYAKWNTAYRNKWGIYSGPAAGLSEVLKRQLVEVGTTVCNSLGIRGAARIDLRVTPNGDIYILEVNPNPPLSRVDTFARSAAGDGFCYDRLIWLLTYAAFHSNLVKHLAPCDCMKIRRVPAKSPLCGKLRKHNVENELLPGNT